VKVVETFEVVRKFLGWSYQEVSMKSGKYSPDFLKQVHKGRTFPAVEKDIIVTYIRGLAEWAVDSVFGTQIPVDTREKLIRKFEQVAQGRNLSLENTRALAEKVSKERLLEASFRSGTMEAVKIEIAWEDELESIICDLNRSQQESLFESADYDAVLVPVSESREKHQFQKRREPAMAVCPRCDNVQSERLGCQCVRCGYGSIFNPNW
jgi:hypothetical protein